MKLPITTAAFLGLIALTGCRSAHVYAIVRNHTGGTLQVVEVDYPSASFGTNALANGAEYHYQFKVLGNGPMKVIWTDATRQEHTINGPQLEEGDEGQVVITLAGNNAEWATHVEKIH